MDKITYEKVMQEYVNAPYPVLLSVAQESLDVLMPAFATIAPDGNGASVVLPFICVTLAVDDKFTELEYYFIRDITGIDKSYDEFMEMIQGYYTTEWLEAINNLFDSCPEELQYPLLSFCVAFAAVDERISREENTYIAMLLS